MTEDDGDGELKTTSFRAEREKLERLKHLINRRNFASGPGGEDITLSDVLRECIDEKIEEMEREYEEGNSKRAATTAN